MFNTSHPKLLLYKLKEHHQQHGSRIRTLCNIANYKPSNYDSILGHCMASERRRWIKALALHMSQEIAQLKTLVTTTELSRLGWGCDAIMLTKGLKEKTIKLIRIQTDLHLIQSEIISKITYKLRG